jgi:hypothetical protein
VRHTSDLLFTFKKGELFREDEPIVRNFRHAPVYVRRAVRPVDPFRVGGRRLVVHESGLHMRMASEFGELFVACADVNEPLRSGMTKVHGASIVADQTFRTASHAGSGFMIRTGAEDAIISQYDFGEAKAGPPRETNAG